MRKLLRSKLRVSGVLGLVLAVASVSCVSPVSFEERERAMTQAEARRNVGMDHLAKGRTAMAIRDFLHADELLADQPLTLLWLGEAFRRKGRLEEAEGYMIRAYHLVPEDQKVILNLSALYIQLERYDEAIRFADILIEDATFSAPWRALTNRGWAHLQAGRLVEAEQSFQEALDYRYDYWPALLNLGILANMQGHRRDAVDYFQRALEVNLGYNATAEVNYRLGELYVSVGRRALAVDHFQTSLESSPGGRWGRKSRDYLKLIDPDRSGQRVMPASSARKGSGWPKR